MFLKRWYTSATLAELCSPETLNQSDTRATRLWVRLKTINFLISQKREALGVSQGILYHVHGSLG